jgi:hypothetical protein
MAYTTINKSTDYFNTKLYTGTGSTQYITGVGFQPDMNWIKTRTRSGYNHCITDAVRGATKVIRPNLANVENTYADSLTSFDSDGFSLGADINGEQNKSGDNYASWNWKANGAGSANTDGSISSTVSANTTAGFSIVKWTGTGSSGTIGHGLGVTPKVVIVKRYTAVADWVYYTTVIDGTMDFLYLNTTASKADSSVSVPTSTVFSKNDTNGETQIAYCFAEKTGYSKFGSYVGNGNADGTFVYTGFKPAFVIQKNASAVQGWQLQDNKRLGYNPDNYLLQPNDSAAESALQRIDLLSNGFKVRTTDAGQNASGNTYIYMAFASAPLVGTNNIPATAR